jgi:hypothetical protein
LPLKKYLEGHLLERRVLVVKFRKIVKKAAEQALYLRSDADRTCEEAGGHGVVVVGKRSCGQLIDTRSIANVL